MKIEEILAEMPNLNSKELNAIRAMAHELEVKAINRRLEMREAGPWPPPRDPKWDEFIEWLESQPDDDLPDDLAHNHDRYKRFSPRLRP